MASYTFYYYSTSKNWAQRKCSITSLITCWFCTPVLSSAGNVAKTYGSTGKNFTSIFSLPFHFLSAKIQLHPHKWSCSFGGWQTFSFYQMKREREEQRDGGMEGEEREIDHESLLKLSDDFRHQFLESPWWFPFLILPLSSIYLLFSFWPPSLALDFVLNLLASPLIAFSGLHSFI